MHGKIVNRIYYKREKEKDSLRMGDSWTCPLSIIFNVEVDKFVYETERHRYEITRDRAMRAGFANEFKCKAAWEKKWCIPKKYWGVDGNKALEQVLPEIVPIRVIERKPTTDNRQLDLFLENK